MDCSIMDSLVVGKDVERRLIDFAKTGRGQGGLGSPAPAGKYVIFRN